MGKRIPLIVITGGPCGGKTTAMEEIPKRLRDMGYRVIISREVATDFFTGGIPDIARIAKEDPEMYLKIQEQILLEIIFKLRTRRNLANILGGEKTVLLLDRGPMDASAYMPQEQFFAALKKNSLNVYDARDSFDGVVHLVSAADGAEEFYTLANNEARRETPIKARFVDKEVQWAWVGVPHFKIIDNSTDFDGKLERLFRAILGILGEPKPLEIERKFLLARKPDFKSYPLWRAEKLFIEQMYVAHPDLGELRIRKRSTVKFGRGRSQGDSTSYYKTRKVDISPAIRREDEEYITWNDYEHLKAFKDFNRQVIRKHRYCFVYKNQYFELDVLISPERAKGLCLLEIELVNEKDPVDLPSFLAIEREVTD
ncbi:MAG: AAA family ATPase, partial [Candidatus Spechtbacterales bacterium]